MRQRLKLAIVGDPHLAIPQGSSDPYLECDPGRKLHAHSLDLLRGTLDEVRAEEDVDAILLLGDLTRDSEEFNHAAMLEILTGVDLPLYIILGNHDLLRERNEAAIYPDTKRLDRPEVCRLYAGHGLPEAQSTYKVRLPGDVDLLVLDSNLSLDELNGQGWPANWQEDGQLGERRLDWLSAELKDSREAGHLPLVGLHHSLLPQSPAERSGHVLYETFRFWRLHDADEALQRLSHYDVPLVLSGHLHAQSINAEAGVTNLVTAATVSYPHAWRLLTVYDDAIYVESRRLQSIPGLPELQAESRRRMSAGMGELVERKVGAMGSLAVMAGLARELVTESHWWARFADGTLADFKLGPADLPETNFAGKVVLEQFRALLNEYGSWKAARPDPHTVEIPLPG